MPQRRVFGQRQIGGSSRPRRARSSDLTASASSGMILSWANKRLFCTGRRQSHLFVTVVKIFVLVVIGFAGGVQACAQSADLSDLVESAWHAVDSSYYDTTYNGIDWKSVRRTYADRRYADREEAYDAIREMLALLGNPATRFLTAAQSQALMGDFAGGPQDGIGLLELLSVDTDESTGEIVIVTPVPGGPAARASLRPGDVIVSIDGANASDLGLEAAAERMRGEAGSTVTLRIRRGGQTFDRAITRETVPRVHPVNGGVRYVDGRRIGYIGLRQFIPEAVDELTALLDTLDADGYVVDLRNNPGGFVPVLQQVAGLFLGDAPLARMRGRSAGPTVLTSTGDQRVHAPLAVLVNEGTASAAEVLASALQYHGRAVLIGTTTFGKGLAHGLVPLPDGSAVMPTVGRLETIAGADILTAAVSPDHPIRMPASPVIDPSIDAGSPDDRQFMRAAGLMVQQLDAEGE